MSPPATVIELSLRLISPPTRLSADKRSVSRVEIVTPSKLIPAAASPKPKAAGAAVVKPLAPVSDTNNRESSAKTMLSAVEICTLPFTSILAPAPKAMPLGLMRKRLASVIVERNNPSICEALSPLTRAIILLISLLPVNVADSPASILKVKKVCNKLLPRVRPRSWLIVISPEIVSPVDSIVISA